MPTVVTALAQGFSSLCTGYGYWSTSDNRRNNLGYILVINKSCDNHTTGVQSVLPIRYGNLSGIGNICTDKVAQAFLTLILGILEVVATNIPLLIQAGVDIIVAFITGIASAVPQLVDAGFQAIITFIGLA